MGTPGDGEQDSNHYERIVEAMGDGVYALDTSGTYIDANDYLLDLSGYTYEELVGADPSLLHTEAEIARFEEAIDHLFETDDDRVETVEATMETAAGESVPVEVNMTILREDGDIRGTVGVVREISDRKARERELERYETIVRTIPDEVYTADENGYLTSVMPPAGSDTSISGYSVDELVGEHVSIVMSEDDIEQAESYIRDIVVSDDRETASFEMDHITKDGEAVPHENHIAPLPSDENGDFQGTAGVLRDITERKERERKLRHQNERLEEFASVVSHDLRNPLNLAKGRLELLQAKYDDPGFDDLATAHERMEAIIEDVLTLAREGATVERPQPVSLDAVALSAWGTVESTVGDLTIEGDATVMADRDRLQRLLENLFRNAIEHGGDPGTQVGVTVGPVTGGPGGGLAGFYVADDGPGIPEGDRDDVFESGFTTASDGTGFGLAIVSEIAEAHGWSVTVTESESGGARFEVTGVETA
jgi:PAS domain S-box-containing protein